MENKRKIGGKRSGKVVMQKIDCKKKRQVTFSKRRRGIMNKAAQICSLFDHAQVVFIAQSEGKQYFTYATHDLDAIIDGFLDAHAQPAAAREFEECHEEQAPTWLGIGDGMWNPSAETVISAAEQNPTWLRIDDGIWNPSAETMNSAAVQDPTWLGIADGIWNPLVETMNSAAEQAPTWLGIGDGIWNPSAESMNLAAEQAPKLAEIMAAEEEAYLDF